MIFTNTISLILALAPATLFAAPTATSDSIAHLVQRALPPNVIKNIENGVCDLSKVQMPVAPTPLPSPAAGLKLSHIALGHGTQNYTCATASESDKPTPVGAIAQLYNVTCQAVRAPAVLKDLPALAFVHGIPTNEISDRLLEGHHEFTAAGSPLFVLDSYGFALLKKAGASDAPKRTDKKDIMIKTANYKGDVPWLKLEKVDGNYQEVYRIHTAGGTPPANCKDRKGDIIVEYATLYYFYN